MRNKRLSSRPEGDLEIRNTRSISLAPQSRPDSDFEKDSFVGGKEMQLLPVFTGEHFIQIVAYPVIVESWDKKKSFSRNRRWLTEFTDQERKLISSYYARFYKWHLISGGPKKVSCRLSTISVLQRAVNFFASI
jgi:hypothetical protein